MALDFPNPPVVDGQEWTDPSNGVTYKYELATNSGVASILGGGGSSGPANVLAGVGLTSSTSGDTVTISAVGDPGFGVEPEASGLRLQGSWSNITELP